MAEIPIVSKSRNHRIIFTAWAVTLFVSLLPDILFREIIGSSPAWLFWAKVGLLSSLVLLSLAWKSIRALWLYFTVVLAVYLLEWGVNLAYQTLHYTAWFARNDPFVLDLAAVQVPRATMGLLLVLVMLVLTRSFRCFFFVPGNLDAPARPIPWILTRPPSWRILAPAIAAAMCLGLVFFTLAFGRQPSIQSLGKVLPLLPFILLFAASNAFGEEMLYRAPWLGALEGPIGANQALLITAAYFGLGHFYGIPYGITGVIMAFIPGWLIGKSILETHGFTWAWFIHVCMDMTIFFFMALGSVTPGG